MPERTFGRTVKYRRTQLGLSQAKLGELVGRSASSIRSWERDKTFPSEPSVITALAAILGVDERMLFEKAGQAAPVVEEAPTIEQALATLDPEAIEEELKPRVPEPVAASIPAIEVVPDEEEGIVIEESVPVFDTSSIEKELTAAMAAFEVAPEPVRTPQPVAVAVPPPRSATTSTQVAYVAPPPTYVVSAPTPRIDEPSYMEDRSQRQLYRVRTLATIVILVALGITLLWAFGEGFGALGDWWDEFFGNLRL